MYTHVHLHTKIIVLSLNASLSSKDLCIHWSIHCRKQVAIYTGQEPLIWEQEDGNAENQKKQEQELGHRDPEIQKNQKAKHNIKMNS